MKIRQGSNQSKNANFRGFGIFLQLCENNMQKMQKMFTKVITFVLHNYIKSLGKQDILQRNTFWSLTCKHFYRHIEKNMN